MCEKLAKENDKLKLDLETSINLNKLLEKQLMKLQKENDRVEADYNQIANNLIEENSNNESQNLRTKLFNKDFQQKMKMNKNNIKPLESFKQNKNQNPYKIFESIPINSINKNEKAISSEKLNNLYTDSKAIANEKSDTNIKKKIVGRGVSANTFRDNLTPNQLEIKNLKIELEKTQKEYNKIYKKYIESQKIKTDAQQLLQKCIEDVQIQLSQTNTKYNELIQSGKQNEEETNDVMSLKKTLEQKLKVLTFIYDNGIQNLKSHKTGLFYKK
jgi:hypothetical protein